VTVQFPDDFVVAHFVEIKKIDPEPRLQWSPFPVHGIEMPADGGAEVQVFIAEKAKTVLPDLVRLMNDEFSVTPQLFAKQGYAAWDFIAAKRKFRFRGPTRHCTRLEVVPESGASQIQPLARLLTHPGRDLGGAHSTQARPLFAQLPPHCYSV